MFAVCHIGEPGGRCSATVGSLYTVRVIVAPVTAQSLVHSLPLLVMLRLVEGSKTNECMSFMFWLRLLTLDSHSRNRTGWSLSAGAQLDIIPGLSRGDMDSFILVDHSVGF